MRTLLSPEESLEILAKGATEIMHKDGISAEEAVISFLRNIGISNLNTAKLGEKILSRMLTNNDLSVKTYYRLAHQLGEKDP